jgi:hypothetical protein
MKQSSFVWRLWLQLNEKPFDVLPLMAQSFFSIGGKPSASKPKCAVCIGTQKYLRNAAACGLKEWGLDSPPVYDWYYYKQKFGIQLFASKPIYADVCCTGILYPFTDLFNPKVRQSSVQTPPKSSSALLYIS